MALRTVVGAQSRRRGGGPHGERGATQEPHSTPAQNTEAAVRASLLTLPRQSPGLLPGAPVLPSRAVNMLPWVMDSPAWPGGRYQIVWGDPLTRIRHSMDDHVPAGPRAEQLIPARPHAGRGVTGRHVPLSTSPPGHRSRRHVPRTTPRGQRAKRPPSRPGRRDRRGHGAQCKAGPAHGAGSGPRAGVPGPARLGGRPARRAGRRMPSHPRG
jgi:hypothetical protein